MPYERIKNLIQAEQESIARNSPYKGRYMSAYYDGFNTALTLIKELIIKIEDIFDEWIISHPKLLMRNDVGDLIKELRQKIIKAI